MTNSITWNLEDERDLWRAICAPERWFDDSSATATHPDSLWWFIHLAWGAEFYFEAHPEQPRWLIERLHKPYLRWLQHHLMAWRKQSLAGSTDRYYIASILPRGFGKTVTTTKSAMIWMHLEEPDMSTLIASSTGELSADVYKSIMAVLSGTDEDSWFTWLYGNWRGGSKEWTKTHLVHSFRRSGNLSEPSFDTTSVDVGMTGYHHRIHVWDDPLFANKRRMDRDRYDISVHTAVNASYNALQTNGLLALVLTRYYDDDVAGRHLREEGVRTWSGMDCPNLSMFDKVEFGQGIWHVYFLQTEDELTGEPTHPVLWDRAKIAEAKRRDPEDFACQQQNNPGSGERAPIIESQVPSLYMDYADFNYEVPLEGVTVHIDTAFKTPDTIRTGDDNAIVPFFHDARRNGMVYLDTDNMKASNEWREEEFNTELVKTLLTYRRKIVRLKALTDETEKGGKAGSYKNRLISIVAGTGIPFSPDQFKQINRTSDKRARIRSGAGYWVEGFVKILLHKSPDGKWIIPPVVRKLINQVIRVDVTQHDDLADAAMDVFLPTIWRRPLPRGSSEDEGSYIRHPGDDELKAFSRPITTEELYEMIDHNKEIQETMGPGRGWDTSDYDEPISPREPV